MSRAVFTDPVIGKSADYFPLSQLAIIVLTCAISFTFVLTACTTASPTPVETPTSFVIMTAMAARLDGKLVEIDGCIRVKYREQEEGYALVWPSDHKMTIENGQVRVLSGLVSGKRREVILKLGEMVTLSGGIVVDLDEQLKQTIPANCPGPYWAVGNTIRAIATPTP